MTVQQTFYNEESNPIEAIYVFPLDTKAAVCQFSIRTEDHIVHGGMEDRALARETYDLAIADGHGAFLLEQPMPDVFQINIGNLAPGEHAEVTIAYLKLGGEVDESEFPIPTWFSPRERQTATSASFLAVEERAEERKPIGRMVTRKVPLAPAPGDYFYFGASVGPKLAEEGAIDAEMPAEEEETSPPAVGSRALELGTYGHSVLRLFVLRRPKPFGPSLRLETSASTLDTVQYISNCGWCLVCRTARFGVAAFLRRFLYCVAPELSSGNGVPTPKLFCMGGGRSRLLNSVFGDRLVFPSATIDNGVRFKPSSKRSGSRCQRPQRMQ